MKHAPAVEQTLKELLASPNSFFVVPCFQRPYTWSEDSCEELWNDFVAFAFPNGDSNAFDRNTDKYFIGLVITYTNEQHQEEIVDGQQRITSLFLLARALYETLDEADAIKTEIGKCIWEFDEFNRLLQDKIKLKPDSTFDNYTVNLTQILISGIAHKKNKDAYSDNYRYFRSAIKKFQESNPTLLPLLASRIINNIYVIKLSTTDFDDAYQLFQTVNAKGESLSRSDIFKAKLCQYAAGNIGTQNLVAHQWKSFEDRSVKIFASNKSLSPVDYIFFLYCHKFRNYFDFRRFHNFFLANNCALLKAPQTLQDIDALLNFFLSLTRFSSPVFVTEQNQRLAFIAISSRANVWPYLAKFFFANRDSHNGVDNDTLHAFLERLIAVIIGNNASGSYDTVVNRKIYESLPFLMYGELNSAPSFSTSLIKSNLQHFYRLPRQDKIARVLLYWWTFKSEEQILPEWKNPTRNSSLQTEHIVAKAISAGRMWNNPDNVNLLGNLALLEQSLNKKANARSFQDKALVYRGLSMGKTGTPTFNNELVEIAKNQSDFDEIQILERNNRMCEAILELLAAQNLLVD